MKEIFKLRTTKLICFGLILVLNSTLVIKINHLRRAVNDAIGDFYEFRDVFKNYISPTIDLIEIISIIIFVIIIMMYLRFVLYSSKLNK